jgi:hypothetical protein
MQRSSLRRRLVYSSRLCRNKRRQAIALARLDRRQTGVCLLLGFPAVASTVLRTAAL